MAKPREVAMVAPGRIFHPHPNACLRKLRFRVIFFAYPSGLEDPQPGLRTAS